VSGHDSYTAFGFANPTRRVLATVLHTRTEVTRLDTHQNGSDAAHVGYSSDVIEVVEQYLYRPLRRPFGVLVRLAQRLQSGHLAAYLAARLAAQVTLLSPWAPRSPSVLASSWASALLSSAPVPASWSG
jgi:hydrogenase-4 component B